MEKRKVNWLLCCNTLVGLILGTGAIALFIPEAYQAKATAILTIVGGMVAFFLQPHREGGGAPVPPGPAQAQVDKAKDTLLREESRG